MKMSPYVRGMLVGAGISAGVISGISFYRNQSALASMGKVADELTGSYQSLGEAAWLNGLRNGVVIGVDAVNNREDGHYIRQQACERFKVTFPKSKAVGCPVPDPS